MRLYVEVMSEYYKGVRVASAQRVADVSDVPVGPRFKGVPRDAIDDHEELSWMLGSEQKDVVTAGSEEGEFVWVLAAEWDEWLTAQ